MRARRGEERKVVRDRQSARKAGVEKQLQLEVGTTISYNVCPLVVGVLGNTSEQ